MRILVSSLLLALTRLSLPAQTPNPAGSLTLEAVAAHPEWWPKQVITKEPATINVMSNGQAAGTATISAGQLMKLVRVNGAGVDLEFNGSRLTLPAVQTDVLAGAAQMKLRQQFQATGRVPGTFSSPVAPSTAAAQSPATTRNTFAERLERSLVRVRSGNLDSVRAGESGLVEKKYIALYFSASWCGPCRRFTPSLVAHYNQRRDKSALYDLVFVSSDHSAQEMAGYMKTDQMPWLAIDFGQTATLQGLKQEFGGPGIPCLVIIDSSGKVVSHSYEGAKYVGPQKVLRDLDRLLDQG